MAFLDKVILPNVPIQPIKPKMGGFLANVSLPTARTQEVLQTETEAQKLGSIGSILKETGRDLFDRIIEAGRTFGKSLFQIYSKTPEKLAEDVKAGAEDIEQGKIAKGIIKAGFRTAGDVANAIFAPISSAIGATLQLTGTQNLIDKTGKVIADKSGITDWPKFQKFAIEHPNAGEDFERLLLLVLSAGEKGKIEPQRFVNEVKIFADKIIGKPPPPPPGALISFESVLPKTRFFQQIEIPSGEPIELSAPQQRLLLKAGEQPIIEPTKIPVYRKTQVTKNTILNKGNIISIPDVGNWIVSDIKTRLTARGGGTKERIAVLKDSQGNVFEEAVLDLTGSTQIRKVGERLAPVAKAPPKIKESQVPKVEMVEPRVSPFKEEITKISQKTELAPFAQEAKPVIGEKPSKVGVSIKQRAIEKKLTEGFEGTAGFDPITIKEQARLVADLIAKDLERAKKMVKGEEAVPDNLRGASLITGLEEYALQKGDIGLLKDLATSPLTAETSRYAQELRVLAERQPQSPVKIIQDVSKARETAIEKHTGKKVSKAKQEGISEIKTEIKKSASKRPTWEEFTRELTCNF